MKVLKRRREANSTRLRRCIKEAGGLECWMMMMIDLMGATTSSSYTSRYSTNHPTRIIPPPNDSINILTTSSEHPYFSSVKHQDLHRHKPQCASERPFPRPKHGLATRKRFPTRLARCNKANPQASTVPTFWNRVSITAPGEEAEVAKAQTFNARCERAET
jgi:hypothetical protein